MFLDLETHLAAIKDVLIQLRNSLHIYVVFRSSPKINYSQYYAWFGGPKELYRLLNQSCQTSAVFNIHSFQAVGSKNSCHLEPNIYQHKYALAGFL